MFQANPSREFEHFLAEKLSMTVDRLLAEMSSAEFERWAIYYARIAQNKELDTLMGVG